MEEKSSNKWIGLVSGLIAFFEEQGYGCITKEKAEFALLDFIKDNSSDIVLSAEDYAIDSVNYGNGSSSYQNLSRTAMYVSNMSRDSDNESYKYLIDLCFGNSLAGAVFWWDDDRNDSHLRNLSVYLDSPIVFRILGFDDEGYEEATIDLVVSLEERGAHLFVFEHVLSEIFDVFESTKQWIGNPAYDPLKASKTAQKVIELGLSSVEVEQIIAGIPDKLEHFGIIRKDAISANDIREFQIDEGKLHSMISDAYEMRDRSMDETIRVDVNSIGYINKLRNGETVVDLDKAKAVLCTSNRTLSQVAFKFECEEYSRPDRSIPLCMPDITLVTIAWLESPSKGKRIAQRRIIAQTNGLIEPTTAIKRKFCADLKKRRDDGRMSDIEYLAIVRESTVNRILAKRTGNNPDRYTNETLDEILNHLLEEKAFEKNKVIQEQSNKIITQHETIAGYEERDERRAVRWGWYLVALFVALVILLAMLVERAFPDLYYIIIGAAIISNILITVFNDRIRNLGISIYKKFHPSPPDQSMKQCGE